MQLLIWEFIHDWIYLQTWMQMNGYITHAALITVILQWQQRHPVYVPQVWGQQMLLWASLDTRVGETNKEGTLGPSRQNINQTARSVTRMRHVQVGEAVCPTRHTNSYHVFNDCLPALDLDFPPHHFCNGDDCRWSDCGSLFCAFEHVSAVLVSLL